MIAQLILVALMKMGSTISENRVPTQFKYLATAGTRSVSVVGQFNNWDRARNPLHFVQSNQDWEGSFEIPVGAYQYLFCEDGKRWLPDPSAKVALDGNGNKNSLLIVTPNYYKLKAGILGDGEITTEALLHEPDTLDTCRIDKNSAWVSLRTRASDVQKVFVVCNEKRYPAQISEHNDLYDIWKAIFPIQKTSSTSYYFELLDGSKTIYFGKKGASVTPHTIPFRQNLSEFPLPHEPQWIKKAIIYQIFPDRFENSNHPFNEKTESDWLKMDRREQSKMRQGGTINGIIDKLHYLKDLGINCIYLNPIFESASNHGYDTIDYLKIDHRFGTNQDLKHLVHLAHKNGIRVILDGVFNHSDPGFFAFKDILKNQEKSKFLHWYFISRFPVRVGEGQQSYRTFGGVPTMPKLNQDNPETAHYFLKVATYWIKYADIDGWRLDVGDEISQNFWRKFRTAVKKAKPDAYIVGEEWGDAHQYLQGDMHDAVMNYRWRQAVLDYFVYQKIDAKTFVNQLNQIKFDYPTATLNAQFNLLGSHDTPRLMTLCKGDFKKFANAVTFQFMYAGVPTIYYGDEIGMEGATDPDDRRPMVWNKSKWDLKIRALYEKLINERKSIPALSCGTVTITPMKNGVSLNRTYRGVTKTFVLDNK